MPDWRHAIERRLDGLRLPPAREAEVVEELAQHLDDRYADLRSGGASEEDARRDALAELDEADFITELTGVEPIAVEPLPIGGGSKDGIVSGAWQDIRFGGRMLRKDAGASLVIVLTLGLAIAANAIVFGFADLLLLRPLPIGNAARLIAIYGVDRRQATDRLGVSAPDYLELSSHMATLDAVLAMQTRQLSLTGSGEPMVVQAANVTPNLFRVWDISPELGRLLLPGEDSPGPRARRDPLGSFVAGAFRRRQDRRRPRRHAQRRQPYHCRRADAGDRGRDARSDRSLDADRAERGGRA